MLFQNYSGKKSCGKLFNKNRCFKLIWLPARVSLFCIFNSIILTAFTNEVPFSINFNDTYYKKCNSSESSNKSIVFSMNELKGIALTFCNHTPAMFIMPATTNESNIVTFLHESTSIRVSKSITCDELKSRCDIDADFKTSYEGYQDILNRTIDCGKSFDKCSTCLNKYKEWLCTQFPFSIENGRKPEYYEENHVCLECPSTEADNQFSFGGYVLFTCQVDRGKDELNYANYLRSVHQSFVDSTN
ncbi:uncharacterized protein LOC105848834 isoform X2 [Hydra vulgaris]|uniref:Uncharacterized protein LOC105848834 isoform X2 n=1 Tax=Hydra vulgaris TaxID=6087 RepID=A0ABM4B575_HYDVU